MLIKGSLKAGLIAGLALGLMLNILSTPLIIRAERILGEETSFSADIIIGNFIGGISLGIFFGLSATIFFAFLIHRMTVSRFVKGLITSLTGLTIMATAQAFSWQPNIPGAGETVNSQTIDLLSQFQLASGFNMLVFWLLLGFLVTRNFYSHA